MRVSQLIICGFLVLTSAASAQDLEVKITPHLAKLEVMHQGRPVVIQREQNTQNTIDPDYAKTSRECPPFCIQPMNLAPGVETVGELEVLEYLEKMSWNEPVLVIDTRTENWMSKGTIPGSVNIPWIRLNLEAGGNPLEIGLLLSERFGVKEEDGLWNYSAAKTLVLFCNGPWCGQSPAAIRTLLRYGYPPGKLKWYRGGMQAWESFGLTIVKE